MPDDVPFDVWNGEDLATSEVLADEAPEALAMHVEDDEPTPRRRWSELIAAHDAVVAERAPVSYFADEQPDEGPDLRPPRRVDGHEVDLEELLARQHYVFPT